MEALMEKRMVEDLATHFSALSSTIPLHTIRNAEEYELAVLKLNQLLDAGAAEETHPLANLVDLLGTLLSAYDDQHYPQKAVSPIETLRFLMEEHRLSQSDLPEIGSQGVVSEILHGKRELNVRQIKALAERFAISPSLLLA
jgi:HTH-type transcriptional regulator/antitoxin HigA